MAVGTLALFYPIFLPVGAAAIAYAGHRALYPHKCILLLLFLVVNWKSLPLAWTVRIFHSFIYHVLRRPKVLPQRALFHT
ncbi:hypothetical protein RB596_009083 [Gaeumannomyces avenae]